MSDQEIDRLFREKLSDRPFEPSESDLAEMRALIDQRGGSAWLRRWWKPSALALVAVIGGYLLFRSNSSETLTSLDQATHADHPTSNTKDPNGSSTNQHEHSTTTSTAGASQEPNTTDTVGPTSSTTDNDGTHDLPASDRTTHSNTDLPGPSAQRVTTTNGTAINTNSAAIASTNTSRIKRNKGSKIETEKGTTSGPSFGTSNANASASSTNTTSSIAPPNAPPATGMSPTGSGSIQDNPGGTTGSARVPMDTTAGSLAIPGTGLPLKRIDAPPSAALASTGTNADTTAIALAQQPTDSSMTIAPGNDSSSVTPTPQQPTPVLIAPRSEFHLFTGFISTRSTNTNNSLSSQKTPAPNTLSTFGLEGAFKFGKASLASGIHYSAYGETVDLQPPGQWTVRDSTIYSIADSVTIGPDSVLFQPGDTMAETLIILDTIYSVEPATQNQVRTSYLEVPLLAGYEHPFGRWSLGVQGGVFFGFLTTRSGRYAANNDFGSVALADETYKSVTLGYLLRPCVKYRLSEQWSIGLEPFLKGHLTDIVSEGPLKGLRYQGMGAGIGLFWKPAARKVVRITQP
jgi:hypothetical protein